MREKFYKHNNGMIYCDLTDGTHPYNSVTGWGKNEFEARKKAWELRHEIIKQQLKTKIEIPLSNINL